MTSAVLAWLGLLTFVVALDESTAVAGLKDALRVASERAVTAVSAPGGFLDNPKIRIPLPGKLETMASGLRAVGMGARSTSSRPR
jgi:hypothetical protein